MKPKWGPNLKEFKRRFDPGTTSGEGEMQYWVVSQQADLAKTTQRQWRLLAQIINQLGD